MPKVVFLVGLCGAGKSRKADEMQTKDGYVWVEGIHGNPKEFLKLVDSLRAGKNCVAEEFQTITAGYRGYIEDWLKKAIPGVDIEFWFFEKDIVAMTRNVLSRPDHEKTIADHLLINGRNFDNYDIPTNPPPKILPIEPPSSYKAKT
jgi:hypothetical protein